jgi:hypothetical protein
METESERNRDPEDRTKLDEGQERHGETKPGEPGTLSIFIVAACIYHGLTDPRKRQRELLLTDWPEDQLISVNELLTQLRIIATK